MSESVQHAGDRRRSREAIARRRAKRRSRITQLLREAKDRPCADCGIQYPYYVMQFDHVRGTKEISFSYARGQNTKSFAKLLAEIEKCDIVCANCHATRTWQRMQTEMLGSDDMDTGISERQSEAT